MPTWPSNSSNMATLTNKTSARSFTVIGTSSVPGAMTFVYPSITTNTTFHTISATFTNNSTETSNVALYIRGLNNATSTVNQSQTTTIQPGESIRKTLIGNVLTANNGYTAAVGVWSHGTSGQVNMNVTDVQFEEKTHATPFVNGTRSSTESLIDLKRTTDIDVANVSFDSTGQPTFDGTDDSLTIPGSTDTTSDAKTIEIAFKMNGSYSNFSPLAIYANGSSSTNRIWLGLQNNKFRMHGWGTTDPNGTTTILSDEWYICTFSYNKLTQAMKIYTNGVLESSTTNTQGGVTAVSNMNWYLGTIPGGWQSVTYSDVDIPIFKVHSRILSDSEVKQNYNAYKNRFDL